MELADGVEHSHSVERRSLRAEALWALERKEGLAQAITSQWERSSHVKRSIAATHCLLEPRSLSPGRYSQLVRPG